MGGPFRNRSPALSPLPAAMLQQPPSPAHRAAWRRPPRLQIPVLVAIASSDAAPASCIYPAHRAAASSISPNRMVLIPDLFKIRPQICSSRMDDEDIDCGQDSSAGKVSRNVTFKGFGSMEPSSVGGIGEQFEEWCTRSVASLSARSSYLSLMASVVPQYESVKDSSLPSWYNSECGINQLPHIPPYVDSAIVEHPFSPNSSSIFSNK